MQYGLTGLSTRNMAEAAGVYDTLIYRYFKDKEDLLRQAYENESSQIFSAVLGYIDEVHEVPLAFRDKVRLSLFRTWRELLSDPNRLIFVTSYYHSPYLTKDKAFLNGKMAQFVERLRGCFPNENVCVQTMFSLMTILYDSAVRVVEGACEDTPETEEQVFSMFYGLLSSQLKTA